MTSSTGNAESAALTGVGINAGPPIEVVFEWDGTIAYNETVLLSLFVTDHDGRIRQFGHKRVGDEQVQFIFDHNQVHQINTAVNASLDLARGVLRLEFPQDSGAGIDLTNFAEAHAVVNVDGQDVSVFHTATT